MTPQPVRDDTARTSGHRAAVMVMLNLVAPIALYYGLRMAGVGDLRALLIGAVVPGLSAIFTLIRHRRIDGLALFMIATLLLTGGVSLLTGSPRFLLAKDGLLTVVWGAWFFVSLLGGRPVTFTFSRPLLEGRRVFAAASRTWEKPSGESWDALWERLPRFRRVWRVSTVIWGVATLLDAALRVLMAYTLPVDRVPALGGALWPVTFLVLQVITNVYFFRAGLWDMLRGERDSPGPPADAAVAQARSAPDSAPHMH